MIVITLAKSDGRYRNIVMKLSDNIAIISLNCRMLEGFTVFELTHRIVA